MKKCIFFKKLLNSNRKKAFDAYKKGISFYNKMDYARAIDCFERMQSEKPLKKHLEYKLATFYCGLSHRNLGIVAFTRNDNPLALDHFKKALQCNPRHIDLNYFIGICLNNLGEFQAAMDAFKIIQETEPWNIPNKLKMAIILHNLKMWSHAEKIHRDLLEKHPGFADVHYHLGIVLMNQGKSEEAAQSFEKALEINPGYINARIKLGIAQICMGQLSQAEEQFNTILRKKPDYADVNYLLSIIKLEKNDPDAAIQYLHQAVTISPRFKNAQVKLIITLCRQNRTADAQEQLKQALAHYPEDPRLKAVQKFIHVLPADFTGNHTVAAEFKAVFNNENAIAALRNEFHKGLDIMPNFSEIIAIFCNSKFSGEDVGISDFLIPLIKEADRKKSHLPGSLQQPGDPVQSHQQYNRGRSGFCPGRGTESQLHDGTHQLVKGPVSERPLHGSL